MLAPFEASKLKLERAEGHLQEFEAAVAVYLKGKPCVLLVERFGLSETLTEAQSWNVRIREHVPSRFSAVIGDIIHNLRTALDLLACDLVAVSGHAPTKVYFPFSASADELPAMIRKRKVHLAGSDIASAIESLKPYKGGIVALRAIHDLDLTDKHRALLPTLAAVSVPLRGLLGPNVPEAMMNFHSLVAKDGQMIIGTTRSLRLPLGMEIPSSFYLALDFGDPIGHRVAIDGLRDLANEASRVTHMLAALRPGAAFAQI